MLYMIEQSNANTIATEQKELRTIRKWKDLLKKKTSTNRWEQVR